MERNRIWAALALSIAATALLPAFAAAEETKVLHKCVDAKGVTSIQAKPCAKGTKEVWARPAQEAKPTEAELAAARARDARNREEVARQSAELQQRMAPPTPVPGSQLAGTPQEGSHLARTSTEGTHLANTPSEGSQLTAPAIDNDNPPQPQGVSISSCQAAQGFAAAVREKTWIGMTDEQMRRILGWVQDQCRVQPATND